ncbi:MAG: riboflavin biosynthesis protein RibF [Oscillospiraceae bacterium]|nr:riboflavin biosynthesis protein RibF [Oscillospiraceae bacterium]
MEENKRVIALGFFDGVHLGHGALLRLAAQRAAEQGLRLAAITFDTGGQTADLKRGTPLITSPLERADLMRRLYGVEDVLIAPFDRALMHMDWREYVTQVLVKEYRAAHLVAGYDFRFGYRGEGNQERLRLLCIQLGVGCDIVPQVKLEGVPVSSTYIRSLLARGDMERAEQFLGHPFCLTGQVRHGKKLGSRLGFPTLNLSLPEGSVAPPFGVYATQVWVEGQVYPAAANLGVRPTVDDGGTVTVEGTLLNFQGNLYGKQVRMEFLRFLRPERRFPNLEALRAQVLQDIQTTGAFFAQRQSAPPGGGGLPQNKEKEEYP